MDDKGMFNGMKPAEKERWESLKKQLAEAGPRPTAAGRWRWASPTSAARSPPTHLLKRGNWRKPSEEVKPGFLSAFDDRLADVRPPASGKTTGRRTALANWIADPKNPLTARVIVNRVWAAALRPRDRATRPATSAPGRAAHAPRAAGLAGDRVRGRRLEPEEAAPADRPVGRVPAGLGLQPGRARRPTPKTTCSGG